MAEKAERKPFHESIVDLLNSTDCDQLFLLEELEVIGHLIMTTKIPANHDAIAEAYDRACRLAGDDPDYYNDILEDLAEQKREAEEKQREAEA